MISEERVSGTDTAGASVPPSRDSEVPMGGVYTRCRIYFPDW